MDDPRAVRDPGAQREFGGAARRRGLDDRPGGSRRRHPGHPRRCPDGRARVPPRPGRAVRRGGAPPRCSWPNRPAVVASGPRSPNPSRWRSACALRPCWCPLGWGVAGPRSRCDRRPRPASPRSASPTHATPERRTSMRTRAILRLLAALSVLALLAAACGEDDEPTTAGDDPAGDVSDADHVRQRRRHGRHGRRRRSRRSRHVRR